MFIHVFHFFSRIFFCSSSSFPPSPLIYIIISHSRNLGEDNLSVGNPTLNKYNNNNTVPGPGTSPGKKIKFKVAETLIFEDWDQIFTQKSSKALNLRSEKHCFSKRRRRSSSQTPLMLVLVARRQAESQVISIFCEQKSHCRPSFAIQSWKRSL